MKPQRRTYTVLVRPPPDSHPPQGLARALSLDEWRRGWSHTFRAREAAEAFLSAFPSSPHGKAGHQAIPYRWPLQVARSR